MKKKVFHSINKKNSLQFIEIYITFTLKVSD